MPEQPPPTTRIRRPHSGLPSSRRSSETFFAAVSVIVTMGSSRSSKRFWNRPDSKSSYRRTPPLGASEDAALGQEDQLFERRPLRKRSHQDRGAGHVLGSEHPGSVRRIGNGVPERRIHGAWYQHPDPHPVGAKLLGQHP